MKSLKKSLTGFDIGRFTTGEEIHFTINKVSEVIEKFYEKIPS